MDKPKRLRAPAPPAGPLGLLADTVAGRLAWAAAAVLLGLVTVEREEVP